MIIINYLFKLINKRKLFRNYKINSKINHFKYLFKQELSNTFKNQLKNLKIKKIQLNQNNKNRRK